MKTKTQAMEQLLQNEDFKMLFIDQYLGSDIKEIIFNEDIKNQEVQNHLIARTIFKQYIEQMLDYDIINTIKS